MKESNPIEVAEYAISNKLVHEPDFAWWVPKFINDVIKMFLSSRLGDLYNEHISLTFKYLGKELVCSRSRVWSTKRWETFIDCERVMQFEVVGCAMERTHGEYVTNGWP